MSSAQVVWGINTLLEGYQINGTEKNIKAYSTCYYVKATDGKEYFFPTATAVEFSAFVLNKPSGVTLQACQLLENGNHTSRDCTNAGGQLSGNVCRFSSSCPSGWSSMGWADYSFTNNSCQPAYVRCDYTTAGTGSGQFCLVIGTTHIAWGAIPPPTPSCRYTQVHSSYSSWTTFGNICSNQFVCGNSPYYPYTYGCSYQQVCGWGSVTNWGTVCSGYDYLECKAGGPTKSGAYCY